MSGQTTCSVRALTAAMLAGILLAGLAAADEPAVTVLSGFEDDSVAVRLAGTRNISPSDCRLGPTSIPARTGHRSMKLEIGATEPNARADCGLHFRMAMPFAQANRVAAYICIYTGRVSVSFRIRDADGRLFETKATEVTRHGQFVRVVASLAPDQLKPVGPGAKESDRPRWPILVDSFCVVSPGVGQQDVYIDDIEVEHRVPEPKLVRGEFLLDHPTHLYEPGEKVKATFRIENASRRRSLRLSVRLVWVDSLSRELTAERSMINLPASGTDFRSFQNAKLDKRLREPGLYRIIATVRESGWPSAATLETTVAVLPSNEALPRGRATFFAMRSNTLREPAADQAFELDLSRRIGVQMFALETPWRRIEPAPNRLDLDELDVLVRQLIERDIAVCLALTDPPDWLPDNPQQRFERQAALLTSLATHFGGLVERYEAAEIPGDPRSPAAFADALQQRLSAAGSKAVVLASPVLLTADTPPTPILASAALSVLETSGQPIAAAAALDAFASRHKLDLNPRVLWLHRAAAHRGAGHISDAVEVLRTYVHAAEKHLGGVMWFDLRDDSADPRYLDRMRGLVSRDFSPKLPLVGLASSVGTLYGLRYAGPVPGTTDVYDSALFIGAERQVAVLFPKPNRVLPAVVAPIATEAGVFSAQDFERRDLNVLESAGPPLIATTRGPMFVTFTAQRALKDPVLQLAARPWLSVPQMVLCGATADLNVTINAPITMTRNRSRIQFLLPGDAPVRSSLSSRRLSAALGDTIRLKITLTRQNADPFDGFSITLRLIVEGTRVDVPVRVEPLGLIEPVAAVAATDLPPVVGRLKQIEPPLDDHALDLRAAFGPDVLRVVVPRPPHLASGGHLLLGLVAAEHDRPVEVRIDDAWSRPALKAAFRTHGAATGGWRVSTLESLGERYCVVEIPATTAGLERWRPGARLRIAARVVEPPSIFAGRVWALAGGLDASGSSAAYGWFELSGGG